MNEIENKELKALDAYNKGDMLLSHTLYDELLKINPGSLPYQLLFAMTLQNGTHQSAGQSRDLLIKIIENLPNEIYKTPEFTPYLKHLANLCFSHGPPDKAQKYYEIIINNNPEAIDYYRLGGLLESAGEIERSIKCYENAKIIDPNLYGNLILSQEFSNEKNNSQKLSNRKSSKPFLARYPLTSDFIGDLDPLIKNHIANDFTSGNKFVNKKTKFFTMGSCFARNLSRSLFNQGYQSSHLEIAESLNSTFSNKYFIDYLDNHLEGLSLPGSVFEDRVSELMPQGMTADSVINSIKNADVFILTLGVAAVCFDRKSGEFILPKSNQYTAKSLSEKYEFRTTSVSENVKNILSVINFFKKLNSDCKIIITVSPVPMLASFEFKSCVIADCLSKSTMRLVAEEVVNHSKITNIYYYPSFEIFRWAGSNSSSFYAADDGAAWHVSEDKVAITVKSFIDIVTI